MLSRGNGAVKMEEGETRTTGRNPSQSTGRALGKQGGTPWKYVGRSTSERTGGMLEANGGVVKEINHDLKG